MSESLTSQDLTTLKEMPGDLEMGELRKITTLQDIPLADGVSMKELKNSQQKSDEETERKLKTNSLKRFFRLSPKKKFEEGSLDGAEMEFDEANDAANAESAQQESGPKELTGSFSKSTIKSSLNSYWNSVQKKFKKSSKHQNALHDLNEASSSVNYSENRLPNAAENPQDNISNPVDDIAAEEIQSLKISEECAQK